MNSTSPTATSRSNGAAVIRKMRNATILAAFLAAGAAAPALAAEPSAAPIEIRSCTTVYAPAAQEVYAMGMTTATGVQIDFVNRTGLPAEDVTFQLAGVSGALTVADHGTFAPGALIQHVFWTGSAVDPSDCHVASVRFSGGTAYDAAAPAEGNR